MKIQNKKLQNNIQHFTLCGSELWIIIKNKMPVKYKLLYEFATGIDATSWWKLTEQGFVNKKVHINIDILVKYMRLSWHGHVCRGETMRDGLHK